MHRLIFVAGVPATGKTWLGTWLGEQGYLHINAENDDGIDFDLASIHDEWNELASTGRADAFVKALQRLDKPVVVTWGFPVPLLYMVQALRVAGMEVWWINGQRRQARAAYVQRYLQGRGPHPGNFDPQMDKIEQQSLLISAVFEKHVVEGLHPDGTQRTPQDMWAEMAGV